MNAFPLVRTKWSNEHIMAAVFAVLVLYLMPQWVQNPLDILSFSAVLTVGLLIDTAANFIRYKRPVCAVSAAVTAAMLQVLTPGIPLWGRLSGIAVALVIGKHLWGGTGKNAVNPAILGSLFLGILFDVRFPTFTPALILLPAIILSLPFISFRIYAAVGFMSGLVSALIINQELSFLNLIAYGIVFWGCLVVTDPVTITPRPVIGAVAGFFAGFFPLVLFGTALAMILGILAFNLISYLSERVLTGTYGTYRSPFRVNRVVEFRGEKTVECDLTGQENVHIEETPITGREEILKRIKKNEVFGFGGAAFPTYEKVLAVIEADAGERHLIINGVECDPGLIHDQWLLRRYMKEIFQGIQILCKCVKFESVTLAVKNLEGLTCPENLKVYKTQDFYPAGAEKVLIKLILGRALPYETIPARAGILVLNVQTVYSVYEAVCMNRKADTRFLTVANIREKTGMVARVKLGTRVQEIVESVYPQPGCVFVGGGLMQCHTADDTEVVDKTVNFIAAAAFPNYKESPSCSRCGLCTSRCPEGLRVAAIAEMVSRGDVAKTRKYHAERCMNCGTCSYVCLAGRNLSSRVKTAREYLKSN